MAAAGRSQSGPLTVFLIWSPRLLRSAKYPCTVLVDCTWSCEETKHTFNLKPQGTFYCVIIIALLKVLMTMGVKAASLCRSTGQTSTWAGIQKTTLESRTWGSPQTRFGPQTFSCTTGQSCTFSLQSRAITFQWWKTSKKKAEFWDLSLFHPQSFIQSLCVCNPEMQILWQWLQ